MTDKSSRREFLRTVTLAGAAAAAGGVAGCASEKVSVDNNGFIVIRDPELIQMFHEAYDEQVRAIKGGKSNRTGIRFKVPALRTTAGLAMAGSTEVVENDGRQPINNLCGCRGTFAAVDDSGTTTGEDKP